jgi:hypothetical protein
LQNLEEQDVSEVRVDHFLKRDDSGLHKFDGRARVPSRDGAELAASCYGNMGRFYIRNARRPLGRHWMALVQGCGL